MSPNPGPSGQEIAADLAFGLYGLAGRMAAPLVRAHLRRRAGRGREDAARLAERLGHAGLARPAGPLVWLHAASIGEALSALPLLEHLAAARPRFGLLMTTGTVTSAGIMAARLPRGALHQYAPVDLPAAVDRFLGHWRPDLGLLVESELWPNLLRAAGRHGTELVLLNGRISPGSFRSWRRFRPGIGRLLAGFSLVLAQSPEDRQRLEALGARAPRCLGNLKFAAPAPPADGAELAALAAALGPRPRWLAASTHPGEEETAARVHRALAAELPGLVTLIAPRHPRRGAEIRARLSRLGLETASRSRGEAIGPRTEVYLADTLGEMGLWYRLAQAVFLGGSLVPRGGQNLLEPAKLGAALLCGPETANFARVAEGLARAGALERVADGAALAVALGRLLRDEGARAEMSRAARRFADGGERVVGRVMRALAPHLDRAARRHGRGRDR